MNVSQIALSDARASWPVALYKSNARSLSSIARSYSRSIIATLLSPVRASGLSPSSSARSRHARAVSQSAAAIARSPPRSRSSRPWTPIVDDHLIRATDQPAHPTRASVRARYLRDSIAPKQRSAPIAELLLRPRSGRLSPGPTTCSLRTTRSMSIGLAVTPLGREQSPLADMALNARGAFQPSVAEHARNRITLQVGKSREGP